MSYPRLLYMDNSFIEVLKQLYHLHIMLLFPVPHTAYAVNQELILLL